MVLPRSRQGSGLAEVASLTQQRSLEALLERNGSSKDVVINCTGFLPAKIGRKTPQARLELEEEGESHLC